NVTMITSVGSHSCALFGDGTVKCWGHGKYGQLGNGKKYHSSTPVPVSGLAGVVDIMAGGTFTCAIMPGGSMKCWGKGAYGELGNGVLADSPTPVDVAGISDAGAMSHGNLHGCALMPGGTVKCWGSNHWGQLGMDDIVYSSLPLDMSCIKDVSYMSSGGAFNCVIRTSGEIQCWGTNKLGELGMGFKSEMEAPVCENTADETDCSIELDKVNYAAGDTMGITFTASNAGAESFDCGAEAFLKRDADTAVWLSFDDDIFVTVPAGESVVETLYYTVPEEWADTDSPAGSDYGIEPVSRAGADLGRGDNFNVKSGE
ncbi:RCC1 domain-containing protein, partial [bacterium]